MNRATHTLFLPACLTLAAATTAQAGTSTFGQARARELADLGRLPTRAEVVVADIVNYHRHRLPLPRAGECITLDTRFDHAAAAGATLWLQVGYTTEPAGDRAFAPPCAVALAIDCSGSMQEAGKMSQVKAGLRAFVARLRPDDRIALVTFADDARLLTPLRRRGDGDWLDAAITELEPGGSTNLHAGLMRALRCFDDQGDAPRDRRVILLTDGIANRGVTEPDRIVDDANDATRRGISLATIGVGDSLDVRLLQRLARGAHGLFHFVAGGDDVQKVFLDEAEALVTALVRDVTLRVELPPGLTVLRACHEGVRLSADGIEVTLPDLGAGVTGVLMLQCRADDVPADASVTATLRATAADDGRQIVRQSKARPAVGRSYRVQQGDTIDRIARQLYGDRRRVAELQRNNPDVDFHRLVIGQQLRLGGDDVDLEVRKNAAIAALAQGLGDMAAANDARRWAEADRALRLASDEAVRLFPGDDPDLQRTRDLIAGHRRTLARYLDRFRDD